MKIRTLIRIATLATLSLLLFAAASAQDKPKDTVKLGVNFVNSEYTINPIEAVEYLQGIKVNFEAKETSFKGFYLNGVFIYKRNNFDAPVDTYAFGQKLSYRFGPIEPYGQVAFGFDTTYNHDRTFTREYSVGGDLNLGHVYLRLAEFSWKRTEGFLSPATQTVSAGLGARF
jgi:hypothetical protein